MAHEILVSITRGNLDESHHHGAYCVVRDGRIERQRGDLNIPIFLRSAAKPFQGLTVVESGAPDQFGLTPEELAMVIGSHAGSPRHARNAKSILDKCGESEDLLRCGGHRSLSRDVYEEYVRTGYVWDRIEDNCSGKHAGMIAAAKARGEDTGTYHELSHPVQQENLQNVALLTEVGRDDIHVGTDGCAVPSFAVPLTGMARAIATFTSPDELPYGKAAAARRLMDVAKAHPDMVAGDGLFDTELIKASGGRVFCKEGAEAVEVVGVPGERIGIAVKIADGGRRAMRAVVCALLIDLGLVPASAIETLYPHQVLTREGDAVGAYKVRL